MNAAIAQASPATFSAAPAPVFAKINRPQSSTALLPPRRAKAEIKKKNSPPPRPTSSPPPPRWETSSSSRGAGGGPRRPHPRAPWPGSHGTCGGSLAAGVEMGEGRGGDRPRSAAAPVVRLALMALEGGAVEGSSSGCSPSRLERLERLTWSTLSMAEAERPKRKRGRRGGKHAGFYLGRTVLLGRPTP